MMKTFATLIVIGLSACGPAPHTTGPMTASTENDGCQRVIDLAQVCYDSSNPGTTCSDIYRVAGLASEQSDLRPSERNMLASFCGEMCQARKNGHSWSEVRGAMRNNCR